MPQCHSLIEICFSHQTRVKGLNQNDLALCGTNKKINGVYQHYYFVKMRNLANFISSFLSPALSNVTVAFWSIPVPSTDFTTPIPKRSCITRIPSVRFCTFWSLALDEDSSGFRFLRCGWTPVFLGVAVDDVDVRMLPVLFLYVALRGPNAFFNSGLSTPNGENLGFCRTKVRQWERWPITGRFLKNTSILRSLVPAATCTTQKP